jgi:hypothetical protein
VLRHPIADCPPLVTEPDQVGNAAPRPRLVP